MWCNRHALSHCIHSISQTPRSRCEDPVDVRQAVRFTWPGTPILINTAFCCQLSLADSRAAYFFFLDMQKIGAFSSMYTVRLAKTMPLQNVQSFLSTLFAVALLASGPKFNNYRNSNPRTNCVEGFP